MSARGTGDGGGDGGRDAGGSGSELALLDTLAAEYVLGTFHGAERLLFDRLLDSDGALRALVVGWEARLQGLADAAPRVRPPDALHGRIVAALHRADAEAREAETRAARAASVPDVLALSPGRQLDIDLASRREVADAVDDTLRLPEPAPPPQRVVVERRDAANDANGGWRGAAVAASIIAAGLLALLVGQIGGAPTRGPADTSVAATVPDPAPASPASSTATSPSAVSLLRDGEGRPRYLVEIDETDSSVRITALDADPVAQNASLQLWMADGVSGELRPIGLLPAEPWSSLRLERVPLVDERPAFAVSEEPPGGSPGAGPTGSVVFQGTVHPLGEAGQ